MGNEDENNISKLISSVLSKVLNSLLQFASLFDVTSICNLSPNLKIPTENTIKSFIRFCLYDSNLGSKTDYRG
jgi:hypothetical protein